MLVRCVVKALNKVLKEIVDPENKKISTVPYELGVSSQNFFLKPLT